MRTCSTFCDFGSLSTIGGLKNPRCRESQGKAYTRRVWRGFFRKERCFDFTFIVAGASSGMVVP